MVSVELDDAALADEQVTGLTVNIQRFSVDMAG